MVTQGETNKTSLRWRNGLEPARWEGSGKETREEGRANEADDRQVCSRVWSMRERSNPHINREEDRGAQRSNRAERNQRKRQISNNMTVTMATWAVSTETVTDWWHGPIKPVRSHTDQCQSLLYSTPPGTSHPPMMMPFCCQQHDFMQNQLYCWQICVWTHSLPASSWIWTHFRHSWWNSSVHSKVVGQGLLNTWWGKLHIFDFTP